MKKLFVATCMIFSTIAAANAQWFVGGNINFSESSSRSSKTEHWGAFNENWKHEAEPVLTTFVITPRVGYMFNDRWLAGLGVGYGFRRESSRMENEITTKTNSLIISPFVRCNVLWFGPFMLGIEASGTYSFAKEKDDQQWDRQDITRREYGGRIAPVLELDVSKNLSLECRLNFLSIGYFHTREIRILDREDGYKYRYNGSSNEAVGLISGDEIFRLGDLTFGMIFKF